MKTILNIILGSIFLVGFSQCGSSKNISTQYKTPFIVENATYGYVNKSLITRVVIEIKNLDSKFQIQDIYFNGLQNKAKINIVEDDVTVLSVRFIIKPKLDIIIDADPKNEYGNKAHEISENIPVKLANNEAAISYIENKKIKYFIVKLVKE